MLCRLQVKDHVKKHNEKFTLLAVKDLTCEGFWNVGPEQWIRTLAMLEIRTLEDH